MKLPHPDHSVLESSASITDTASFHTIDLNPPNTTEQEASRPADAFSELTSKPLLSLFTFNSNEQPKSHRYYLESTSTKSHDLGVDTISRVRSAKQPIIGPDLSKSGTLQTSIPNEKAHKQQEGTDFHHVLHSYLSHVPFERNVSIEEQKGLEVEYIEWAAIQLAKRQKAFGPDGGYFPGENMLAHTTDALLPVMYESAKGFLQSAFRSPLGATVRQITGNPANGLGNPADMGFASVMSGFATFLLNMIIIPAIDRRAKMANLPKFEAIDPKILEPDLPKIQLEISESGCKSYVDLSKENVSARRMAENELKKENAIDRIVSLHENIRKKQDIYDGRHVTSVLAKPAITAIFNVLRRAMSDRIVTNPLPYLGVSALSNGLGNSVYKSALELSKALPITGQAEISDLMGGKQRVNLYRLTRPNENSPPLKWSDAKNLPKFAWQSLQESAALCAQSLKTPVNFLNTATNLVVNNILGNTLSAFASLSASQFIASSVQDATKGYFAKGGNVIIQQASQTLVSDIIWNNWKDLLGNDNFIAKQLDRRRNIEQAKLFERATGLVEAAQPHITILRESLYNTSPQLHKKNTNLPSQPRDSQVSAEIDRLERFLAQFQGPSMLPFTADAVKETEFMLAQLPKHVEQNCSDGELSSLSNNVQKLLLQACKDMQQCHAIRRWIGMTPNPRQGNAENTFSDPNASSSMV